MKDKAISQKYMLNNVKHHEVHGHLVIIIITTHFCTEWCAWENNSVKYITLYVIFVILQVRKLNSH